VGSDLKLIPRENLVLSNAMNYDASHPPRTDLYVLSPEMEREYRMLFPRFDYTRYRTFELVAEQIADVPGSVAECGVYLGHFSRMINHYFPNRKLFLYDTFESFDKRDADFDVEADFVKGVSRDDLHAACKTDVLDPVSFIRGACPHPEKLVFRKGYFPETATPDADEEFAFVSLDTDLYKPIYAGLEFFYPRLHEGGSSSCMTITADGKELSTLCMISRGLSVPSKGCPSQTGAAHWCL
jgi:O-methyltransferase